MRLQNFYNSTTRGQHTVKWNARSWMNQRKDFSPFKLKVVGPGGGNQNLIWCKLNDGNFTGFSSLEMGNVALEESFQICTRIQMSTNLTNLYHDESNQRHSHDQSFCRYAIYFTGPVMLKIADWHGFRESYARSVVNAAWVVLSENRLLYDVVWMA